MRIVFMGTPEAAVPTLRRLLDDSHEVVAVWTQPDRPAGRGNKLAAPPVKVLAQLFGLKIYQPEKIRSDEAKSLFASHNADLAVVVAYGRILPHEFLIAPKRGCLNVHFSLLPLYRGAAPVNWAIINGEAKTGVTTMFIEEELDSGPILLQRESQIGERETAPELMGRLAETGADLLGETLTQLDEITPRPQRDRDATFAPILRKEDGVIDWSKDAFTIERMIRGLQPWPNAYTKYKGHRLILWRAQAAIGQESKGLPGAVLKADTDDLLVKCGGDTVLRLLEVQPEAKRRMDVRDFLNGTHLKAGDTFD
ncbi:MAG TPA: methionyl-tRNA formyltransferase [Pyrinomonadaceae bacterium]|nr:methionyl-tRNA formyltransferase [Pyrinomonadaceae bacterium]